MMLVQDALKSLTYVSRAADGLTDEDVFRIYKTATEFNSLDGVTGLLVYDGTVFMQVVEGTDDALSALVTRLKRDVRHRELRIVDQRAISTRSFADWSMKLLRVSRAHMAAVESIETELGPRVAPEIRAMLVGTVTVMHEIA
jgi:hypothetical protein